jgi:hypothetical protein
MKVVCFPVLASVTSKALGQRRLARAWMQVASSMYVASRRVVSLPGPAWLGAG